MHTHLLVAEDNWMVMRGLLQYLSPLTRGREDVRLLSVGALDEAWNIIKYARRGDRVLAIGFDFEPRRTMQSLDALGQIQGVLGKDIEFRVVFLGEETDPAQAEVKKSGASFLRKAFDHEELKRQAIEFIGSPPA